MNLTTTPGWRGGFGLGALLLLLLVIAPACARGEIASKAETIRVSMLVQPSQSDVRWFRDVEMPKGANAWELTEKATGGDVQATYNALYRSHFVDAIFRVEGKDPRYWLIYVWSEAQKQWEPLPVGADLYSLKDGHVLAWYYADTSKEGAVPTAAP